MTQDSISLKVRPDLLDLQITSSVPPAIMDVEPKQKQTRGKARKGPVAVSSSGIVVAQLSSQPYEMRKATQALAVRNVSDSEISFLSRKAYNVMLQFAQETINSSGNEDQIVFSCALSEFEKRVGHTTANGRPYLKQVLRQLIDFKVEFDYTSAKNSRNKAKTATSWGVANMVAEVYIDEDNHTIKWSFPAELSKKMLDPQAYNLIDLRTQMLFTSHSALVLYEICSRYFTSPGRQTFQDHWTGWSTLLSGSKDPHKSFREFNKMLTRALEQVREIAHGWKITPNMTKDGKKFDTLWFTFEENRQQSLIDVNPVAISRELETRLTELGLSKEDIADLLAKHDEEYLMAQADYTSLRQRNKRQDPLTNPKGFFITSVEQNFAKAPRRQGVSIEKSINTLPSIADDSRTTEMDADSPADARLDVFKLKWKHSMNGEVKAAFVAKSDDEKKEILLRLEPKIAEKGKAFWGQYQRKGVSAPSVLQYVADLLFAEQFPSEPSTEVLLMFALSQQKS